MSPRPKKFRKVEKPPTIKGFRPMGSRHCFGSEVEMHFEEFEALKLSDYDKLTHDEASQKMDVSRPTFTRIYEEARRKVATAFVENRPLIIEGGQVQFSEDWFICKHCKNTYAPVDKAQFDGVSCPLCSAARPERMSTQP